LLKKEKYAKFSEYTKVAANYEPATGQQDIKAALGSKIESDFKQRTSSKKDRKGQGEERIIEGIIA